MMTESRKGTGREGSVQDESNVADVERLVESPSDPLNADEGGDGVGDRRWDTCDLPVTSKELCWTVDAWLTRS